MTLEHTKKHLENSWDRGESKNGKLCGILQDKPMAQGHAERHAEALGTIQNANWGLQRANRGLWGTPKGPQGMLWGSMC